MLQRWQARDLEQLQRALADTLEHLVPWMPWAAHTDADSQARFLAESGAGWEAGERFEYAIRDADDGALLGSVGLVRRIGPRGLEIGYWLHRAHTGRGLATLAAAALTEAALALPDADHVEIHHDRANGASERVPKRLGFRKLGSAPQEPSAPGEVGIEVRWRMTERMYPESAAVKLLDSTRAAAGNSRAGERAG